MAKKPLMVNYEVIVRYYSQREYKKTLPSEAHWVTRDPTNDLGLHCVFVYDTFDYLTP